MAACGVTKCSPDAGRGAVWVDVVELGKVKAGAGGPFAGALAAGVVATGGTMAVGADTVGFVARPPHPAAASMTARAAAARGRRRAWSNMVGFIWSSGLRRQRWLRGGCGWMTRADRAGLPPPSQGGAIGHPPCRCAG